MLKVNLPVHLVEYLDEQRGDLSRARLVHDLLQNLYDESARKENECHKLSKSTPST